MNPKPADYWVGSLSTTIAHAAVAPEPKPILQSALKQFLAERPPGNPLGDLIRQTLKETKP